MTGDGSDMSLARAAAALPHDRRTAPRIRVSRTARLRTSFSNCTGELWDLSTTGARFVAENPPKEGIAALLEWDSHDAMCRVIWSQEGACGLQFDRPISPALIDQAAAPSKSEVVATVGNIPLGKRRSALARGD
jgi:hypothetical protein